MVGKLIILLALDSLLSELDRDYGEVSDELFKLVELKILESYGLRLNATPDEIRELQDRMIQDIKQFRDELLREVTSEEEST